MPLQSQIANTLDNSDEISTNREIFRHWKDGYFEGNPLDPLGFSTYRQYGFISVLHATYLRCIKPYIRADTHALEIGPGRGAWTKGMLDAREVWVMDALPESHNKLFQYLGDPSNVRYLQVSDFACHDLPQQHFDYMFSFGCLCHVSFQGITEYAQNLHSKLKPGAQCFWMVADFAKYNHMSANERRYNVIERFLPDPVKHPQLHRLMQSFYGNVKPKKLPMNDGFTPLPSMTWYDAGIDRTCETLIKNGYKIIDRDVGTSNRDPIIHFEVV